MIPTPQMFLLRGKLRKFFKEKEERKRSITSISEDVDKLNTEIEKSKQEITHLQNIIHSKENLVQKLTQDLLEKKKWYYPWRTEQYGMLKTYKRIALICMPRPQKLWQKLKREVRAHREKKK